MKIINTGIDLNILYSMLNYSKTGMTSDIVEISQEEAENIYNTTLDCFNTIDEAVEYVINNNLFEYLGIPNEAVEAIKHSYYNSEDSKHIHLIGRFDFAGGLDGYHLKLIEFNADTPFSIFESSVIQDYIVRLADLNEEKQYNEIFSLLVTQFKHLKKLNIKSIVFTNIEDPEDDITTLLIKDAAEQVGIKCDYLRWYDIIIDPVHGACKVNEKNEIIEQYDMIVKMIPWEIIYEQDKEMFKALMNAIVSDKLIVLNPPYSMIYQSKRLLAILSESFNREYFLKTRTQKFNEDYVKKPCFGREGQNIEIYKNDVILEKQDGLYSHHSYIYQEIAQFPEDDNCRKYQLGSFIIGGEPAGIGFRRINSDNYIITAQSDICGNIIK